MLETTPNLPKDSFTIHQFHGPDNHFYPRYLEKGNPSATDTDPYCFSADDNWQELIQKENTDSEIVKTPPISICLADPDNYPYYQEQYIAPVLIKKGIGLETGLTISPNGELFITSGVYQDKTKKFVLLARKAIIVNENAQIIKNKFCT